jgi:hypothetical protein
MLQKRDDVLGKEHNTRPYIACKSGKWTKARSIDFTEYIDPSMDESINCSKFANRGGLKKFKATMKSFNENYTCPMDVSLLQTMIRKYDVVIKDDKNESSISHWMMNEGTNGVVSKLGKFKTSKK